MTTVVHHQVLLSYCYMKPLKKKLIGGTLNLKIQVFLGFFSIDQVEVLQIGK